MRFIVAVVALFALLAPQAAQAKSGRVDTFTTRNALTHGIAGDERYVFVTEPGIGVAPNGARVVALDRRTGNEVAAFPAPEGGFKLPFTLRVPRSGHLIVLDSGGFPPVGPPVVYDYSYSTKRGALQAKLTRTTSFAGLPLAFAEDVEVLPNGEYVVSESIFGGLWLIGRDGKIRRGLVSDDGAPPLTPLAGCQYEGGPLTVGDLPFAAPGGFLPGAGSLTVRGFDLYLSSTCHGGIQRLPISVLLDSSKPAAERAGKIVEVTPKVGAIESLKGITFNRWDPKDPWIYAGDPFSLELIRVNSKTGKRQELSSDARLFNFAIGATFLPPRRRGGKNPLVTTSDQEYRWAPTNAAITADAFQLPFIMAEYWPRG
jgi:hypothetical protein